ncbi:efflux RND transporter periplasmic adaptor subunit [Algibacter sp. PT7-4]|uniref:efflux RND transporter periplasmic adaptor subunit n=1 Tax=Algibacter ulvanivorans TaxID=3400999 RepID=UPI003AB103CD
MTRKIVTYVVVLLIGVLLGYLFFGLSDSAVSYQKQTVLGSKGSWTCSMHPKIQKDNEGKCPLCAMNLIYVSKQNTLLSDSQFKMSKDAISLANIETTTIGSSIVKDAIIKLSGKIKTNQQTDGVQTSLFNGRVERFYSNYVGKKVFKGQKLGVIYSPELYSAQDELLSSLKYRKTHKNLFTEARNADGLWKVSDAEIDLMLAKKKPMFNFNLYADVSGTITETFVKEGKFYKEGQILFKTSDLRTVWGIFDCYENQLKGVKIGDNIQVLVKGLNPNIINCKVDFIEPIIDDVKRTMALRVIMDNKEGLLKPGMLISAILNLDVLDNKTIRVPKSAVLWTGKRSIVYKKIFNNEEPIFEMVEVELGQEIGDYYEITEGVSMGDVIVVQGVFTIDATAELSGKRSMMSINTIQANNINSDTNLMKKRLDVAVSKINLSNSSKDNFLTVLEYYIKLKDALIKSDFDNANKKSIALENKIKSMLELENHQTKELNTLKLNLNKITNAKTIKEQRRAFKFLSKNMVSITSKISNLTTRVFVQYCDCVDDFTGGSWLSFDSKILNPYFGNAMLGCGRVEQVLN